MVFVIGTHVRSLATHYDAGTEDENGATYSQRLAAKGFFTLSRSFHLVPTLDPPSCWQVMVFGVTAKSSMFMQGPDEVPNSPIG